MTLIARLAALEHRRDAAAAASDDGTAATEHLIAKLEAMRQRRLAAGWIPPVLGEAEKAEEVRRIREAIHRIAERAREAERTRVCLHEAEPRPWRQCPRCRAHAARFGLDVDRGD